MAAGTGAANVRWSGVDVGGPIWSPAVLPWLWTGAFALVLQLLLIKVIAPEISRTTAIVWIVFASHLLLVPFLLRNSTYLGIKLVLLGLSLNLIAMASNGGMMPVLASGIDAAGRQESVQLGDQVAGSKDIYAANPRLPLLSDRIVIRLPGHLVRVISIGDIVVALGTIVALASVSMKVLKQGGNGAALGPVGTT